MIEDYISLPFIIALVECIKRITEINNRWIPLIAIAVGVLTNCLLTSWAVPQIFFGILLGLGASGLYSGVKATAGR